MARTLVSHVQGGNLLGLRRALGLWRWLGRRPHELDFVAFRGFNLKRPNVVDVGANRGQAIASFFRVLVQPRIWSFEPNPTVAAYLSRRFESRGLAVLPYALGESRQTATLYVPRYGRTVWDSRASLDEASARASLGPEDYWRFSARRAAVEGLEVEVRRLDEFGLAPDIVKIDVEGTQDSVIEGGKETIESCRPVILVEGRVVKPLGWLEALGYRAHRFNTSRSTFVIGQHGDLNTFFMHPNHYPLFGVEE